MIKRRIGRAIGALLCAVGLTLAASAPADAQSLFLPVTGAEAGSKIKTPRAKRERLVRIDANVLADRVVPAGMDKAGNREQRAAQLGDTVRLNLFNDVTPTFKRTAVKADPDGGYIWEGEVPGREIHEALLVVQNGQVSGRIQLDQQLFSITPVGSGTHRIVELDPAAFKPEAPPKVPTHIRSQRSGATETAEDAEAAEAAVTISVLVAYTTSARDEAGSDAAIKAEIRRAVQLANQAYARGGLQITLVLAGTMRVGYTESSADIGDDLDVLTSGNALRTVRTRRAELKADLAALFRNNATANACGVAWTPGGGDMPTPSAGTRETGYSIMNRLCVENLSFHHELGHNMGLLHDRYVHAPAPLSVYNFGYVNFSKRQRTVLAYNNYCADRGTFCTRINWFSSPTIQATGNVVIGKAAGTTGAADNTRRLKTTRVPVSKYYQ